MSNIQIPKFPDYKVLEITDSTSIKSLVEAYPTYSDFGFTSMFCWDAKGEIEVSMLNDNLVVLFQDYHNGKKFFSVLGRNKMDESIMTLLLYSMKRGFGSKLKLVPQTVIESIKSPEHLVIEEDRDNFDYILSVRFHAELEGSKNEDRRYRIKKFQQEYGNSLEVKKLDLSNDKDQIDILACLVDWGKARNKSNEEMGIESTAIKRILHNSEHLPLESIGVYIGQKLRGFSIYELVQSSHSVVHFEKCDVAYSGITHFIRNLVAQNLHEKGSTHINYEQDLGIEGLRKSKEMLHPEHFLKKYTVKLKV